jgi:hypothetical protein
VFSFAERSGDTVRPIAPAMGPTNGSCCLAYDLTRTASSLYLGGLVRLAQCIVALFERTLESKIENKAAFFIELST